MAGAKHRRAGNRFERELVKLAKKAGFDQADRTWGSNGQARGLHNGVDIVIPTDTREVHLQAKYTSNSIPKYLTLEKRTDAVKLTERSSGTLFYLMRYRAYLMHLAGDAEGIKLDWTEADRKTVGKLYKPDEGIVVGQAFRESYGKGHILLSEAEYERVS